MRRLSFLFLVILLVFLSACSEIRDSNASVSFSLNTKSLFRSAEDSESLNQRKIIIELSGDFSDKQTAFVSERESSKTFIFEDIPVNSKIFVSAEIYSFSSENESSEDSERQTLLYTGKSEEITIVEGENKVNLVLSKVRAEQTEEEPKEEPTEETEEKPKEEEFAPTSTIQIFGDDSLDYSADAFRLEFSSSNEGRTCTFSAKKDSELVTKYESYKWFVDGKVLSNASAYTLSLSAYDYSAGIHTVLLIATDSNSKLYSASKSFIIRSDTILGTMIISLPEDSASSGTLNIIATKDKENGIYTFTAQSKYNYESTVTYTSFTWMLDGKVKQTSDSNSFSVSLDACSVGTHSLLLVATDSSGKFSSLTVSFTVGIETTVGIITVVFPSYSNYTPSIKLVLQKSEGNYIFTVMDSNYSSATEFVSYIWLVDGKMLSGEDSSSLTVNPESGQYTKGVHRVMVVVKDSNGNYSSAIASFMAGQQEA